MRMSLFGIYILTLVYKTILDFLLRNLNVQKAGFEMLTLFQLLQNGRGSPIIKEVVQHTKRRQWRETR